MMIFSCGKEESGNKPSINHADKVTWATVVKEYPFLDGFPVFDGEVENWQYKELGSMKTGQGENPVFRITKKYVPLNR